LKMAQISKIVRDALARSERAGVHPDPDVLTAFVEHALRQEERARVTEHLATCGECREVVSLSLPELPEAQISAAASSSRPRLWDGLFRWGAAAASLAVVAGLLVEHHFHTEVPPLITAQKTSPVAPSARDELQPSSSPAVPASAATAARTTAETPARKQQGDRVAAATRPVGQQESRSGGAMVAAVPPPPISVLRDKDSYINSSAFNVSDNADQAAVADLRGLSSPAMMVSGALPQLQPGRPTGPFHAPSIAVTTGTIAPEMALLGNQIDAPEPGTAPHQPSASRLGFPVRTVGSITRHLHLTLGAGSDTALAVNGYSFSPAIGQGFVARGREPGSTDWSLGARAFSSKARGLAESRQWKVEAGKLMRSSGPTQWEDANPPGEDSHFTVVESRAAEVWAGASHAAVFHSSDSGANWEKLSLGVGATGDITSISLDGPEVDVTTSENQTWSSNDRGHTWKMVAARQPTH